MRNLVVRLLVWAVVCPAVPAVGLGQDPDPAVERFVGVLKDPDKSADSKSDALVGLAKLGPKAKAALPVVKPFLTAPPESVQTAAAGFYARVGPDGLPDLVDAITKMRRSTTRERCIAVVGGYGAEAKEVVPTLAKFALSDKGLDILTLKATLKAFAQIKQPAEDIVPICVQVVNSQIKSGNFTFGGEAYVVALETLESLGPDAKGAVHALKAALEEMARKGRGTESRMPPGIFKVLRAVGPPAAEAVPAVRLYLNGKYGRDAEATIEAVTKPRPPADTKAPPDTKSPPAAAKLADPQRTEVGQLARLRATNQRLSYESTTHVRLMNGVQESDLLDIPDSVTRLGVDDCPRLSDTALAEVADRLRLQTVDVEEKSVHRPKFLASLARRGALKKFTTRGDFLLKEGGLSLVAKSDTLTELVVYGEGGRPVDLTSFARCRDLSDLYVKRAGSAEGAAVPGLNGLAGLRKLSLSDIELSAGDAEGLRLVVPRLADLSLRNLTGPAGWPRVLSDGRALQKLWISGSMVERYEAAFAAGLSGLGAGGSLADLAVCEAAPTDGLFAAAARVATLKDFRLEWPSNLPAGWARHFAAHDALRTVHTSRRLSPEDLATLARVPRLQAVVRDVAAEPLDSPVAGLNQSQGHVVRIARGLSPALPGTLAEAEAVIRAAPLAALDFIIRDLRATVLSADIDPAADARIRLLMMISFSGDPARPVGAVVNRLIELTPRRPGETATALAWLSWWSMAASTDSVLAAAAAAATPSEREAFKVVLDRCAGVHLGSWLAETSLGMRTAGEHLAALRKLGRYALPAVRKAKKQLTESYGEYFLAASNLAHSKRIASLSSPFGHGSDAQAKLAAELMRGPAALVEAEIAALDRLEAELSQKK